MQIERFDPEADAGASAGVPPGLCWPAPRSTIRTARRCRCRSSPAGWPAAGLKIRPRCGSPEIHRTRRTAVTRPTMPQRENRHLAYVHPQVHPARRRTGIGTALLRHAAARAAGWAATTLTAEARDGSAGEAFARSLGARRGRHRSSAACSTWRPFPAATLRGCGPRRTGRRARLLDAVLGRNGPRGVPRPGGHGQCGHRRRPAWMRTRRPVLGRGPGAGWPAARRDCRACATTRWRHGAPAAVTSPG